MNQSNCFESPIDKEISALGEAIVNIHKIVPDFLKKVSYFFPQSWAVDALTSITLKNKGVTDILPDLAILFGGPTALPARGIRGLRAGPSGGPPASGPAGLPAPPGAAGCGD